MANVWMDSIRQVYANCWLTQPGYVATMNDTVGAGEKDITCLKVPGNAVGPVKIQQGSGFNDGVYQYVAFLSSE